ncbi:protein bangles and beads [Scaptodrosophila lebanonensis]|uniref:Protein bangles and beads n=1 Tax=Drosophila lebanonensis TaxID=7225 RepID=A0A6J2U0V0_DROLE|nr:protein bangles and beads [Scaptodrosophila lebanonensis]
MKCQMILLAAVCLASVWALPVPDEEVAIQPDAGSKAELLGKTIQSNPIEPVPAKPELDAKIEPKTAAVPTPAKPIESVPELAAAAPAAKSPQTNTNELKLQAPDVETAPAIPEKKAIIEENKTVENVEAIEKKQDKKLARTEQEQEPLEAPKAIPLVEAPAANAEVQQQGVEEAQSAVLKAPLASGKSNEPLNSEAEAASKPEAAAEQTKPELKIAEAQNPQAATEPEQKEQSQSAEQPARQERINEIEQKEKAAAPIDASPEKEIKQSGESKLSESNIQVIAPPEIKSAEEKKPVEAEAAATPIAKSAESTEKQAQPVELQKSTETAAESAPVLKNIDASVPSNEKANEQTIEPKAEQQAEAAVIAPEGKKIDETAAASAPATIENNKPVEPAIKSQELTKKEIVATPAAAELKKSSEEKSDKSDKSESKNEDSSESKESDESSDSKENTSN